MAFDWNPAVVDRLRECILAGFSASQFARLYPGLTRNAVIGKAIRAGMPPWGNARKNGVRIMASKNNTVTHSAPARAARIKAVANVEKQVEKAKLEPVVFLGPVVSFDDLGPHQCKWPIGDPLAPGFGYCGAETRGTYCDDHKPAGVIPGKKFDDAKLAAFIRSRDAKGRLYA